MVHLHLSSPPAPSPAGTTDAAALALRVAQGAAAVISAPGVAGIQETLLQLAALIADLPGIAGAMVVAFDEEALPLTSGAQGIRLRGTVTQLEALFALRESLAGRLRETAWTEVDGAVLDPPAAIVLGLPIIGHAQPCGLILVAGAEKQTTSLALDALAGAHEVLAAAILSAIRGEAWRRVDQLQALAQREFVRPKPDMEGLVTRLRELFDAGAVTLLVRAAEDELRLAATTDSQLGRDREVTYQRGEGLTGHVFASGKPMRLSSTGDADEVRRTVGFERTAPTHPELEPGGPGAPSQFLAVPVLFGDEVGGVLRLLRRGGTMRFTAEDERSLSAFAGLLGIYLSVRWNLLLLNGMLESTSEAIAVSRRDDKRKGDTWPRIILANPGIEKLIGLSREQLIGSDARLFYAPGEYEKIYPELEDALDNAMKEGLSEYGPVNSALKHSDGTLKPVEISYRIVANDLVRPPTLFTVGIARDISERTGAEALRQRFFSFLREMRIVYYRADRHGRTLQSTPTEAEITGYTEEELVGLLRDRLYVDPSERPKLLGRLRESGGRLMGQLLKFKRKDGTPFWIDADLRLIKDADGEEDGIEGFYADVSQRMQLQGFLNADTDRVLPDDELFQKLKQHEEFHLDYMTSMAHQLQVPLASLVENLRNYQLGLEDPKHPGAKLPYVFGQAVFCTRLVRNLSYMDKVLRGETFHRDRVSIARLAIETKLDFLPLLQEKDLELSIEDSSLDRYLQVHGHADMLRQVLVNLLDNAIKYSVRRSTIAVRAHQWPQGPVLEISNQGLPIPAAMREEIFERGRRTPQAKAMVPHGTGLGLWLVRKILSAHDATIRCTEAVEEGRRRVVFRIVFPHPVRTGRVN